MSLIRTLCAVLSLLALGAISALAEPVIPVHGTALGMGANGTVILRTDPVTNMVPAQTRAFRIEPALKVPSGTGIDAFLDRSTQPWRLYDASVAGKFVPGLPQSGKVLPVDYGSTFPHTRLVDQNGRLVDLASSFHGKVVLLSFVFTRCPDKDECPTVSAKFGELQKRLDPRHFHLVEVTLDPVYDSPAVLHDYGRQFGANPSEWSIVTGQPHDIQYLLNIYGISSLRVSDANFIHNDKVFVTAPDGKVADIIQTVGFSPDSLAAQARHIDGMTSNVLGRLELGLIASVAALCGGSQFAGVVLLETLLFIFIAICSFTALAWLARKVFWKNA
jgi:protein SCO1/2